MFVCMFNHANGLFSLCKLALNLDICILEKSIYSIYFNDKFFRNILRFLDEKSSISFTDILHICISNHNKGELELWKRNYHFQHILL